MSTCTCDGHLKPTLKRKRLDKEESEFPCEDLFKPPLKRRRIQQEGNGISVRKTEPLTLVPDPQVNLFNSLVEEMRNNISLKRDRKVEQLSPIMLLLLSNPSESQVVHLLSL